MHKKARYIVALVFFLIIAGGLANPAARAQNWVAMPPYNVLWPLWSPVLSPKSPTTGLPTPIIPELSRNTILPVQPVLALNPTPTYIGSMGTAFPWLFYNTPTGVVFYDIVYGLNPWPPAKLLDPVTGAPVPLTLPPDYTFLSLPLLKETALSLIETANLTYLLGYGFALGVNPALLLTYADIWGLPPI
ncbi:MAG: hypothetical protein K6U11_01920 [bacterium]|nr:hypothetical protein [bacterium]